MDEVNRSLLTRFKYSLSVYQRSVSVKEPDSLYRELDCNLRKMPGDSSLDSQGVPTEKTTAFKQEACSLSLCKSECLKSLKDANKVDGCHKSGLLATIRKQLTKTKQRSLSCLPLTMLSGEFNEACKDEARRCKMERGLEISEGSSVDRSELYVGLRFASGACSRLHHGLYKGEKVAVKITYQPDDDEDGVISQRLVKQYTREVKFLSLLNHQNVIKLVGAYKEERAFCILTEYLSGGSLRAVLRKLDHKTLPLPKLIGIALDIAHAMEYIHSQGVIHRDLKPENIILDEDSCAKIADFGIACKEKDCEALADDPGTYRWMAPELLLRKHYGQKVDIYSFGLILSEMITGRIPFEDMNPLQVAYAVVEKTVKPAIPASCPKALGDLIEKCCARKPENRPKFEQIAKVLEMFEAVLACDSSLDQVKNLNIKNHKHWMPIQFPKPKPWRNDDAVHPMPK